MFLQIDQLWVGLFHLKKTIVKVEQLIVQHLYAAKKVTLQGIGTFHLNKDVALPAEGDSNFTMPDNAITFEYNLKAEEDEALILFIVQQSRKMKSLASADLDSYVVLAKQFLNIGKPLLIEGIGTVQKNQQGTYEFHSGQFITPRIDDIPRQLKEKQEDNVSFESVAPKRSPIRKIAVAVGAVLLLGGIAFAAYFFWLRANIPVEPANELTTSAVKDNTDTSVSKVVIDSNHLATDTMAKPVSSILPTHVADTNHFKVVFRTMPTLSAAEKELERLTVLGHQHLEMIKKDSSHFQLAIAFQKPWSDSTWAKDSLRKFYFPKSKPFVIK